MTQTKRFLSIGLVFVMLFSMLAIFNVDVSAATVGKKYDCIVYNYWGKNAGKSAPKSVEYYAVKNNKKLTLDCYWNTEKLNKQTSIGLGGKRIKDYLRFDVQIIDEKTGMVVNHFYSLKPGATFKVYSAVPYIKSKTYTVKVASYLYNYETYVNSNLAGVATSLKYRLK